MEGTAWQKRCSRNSRNNLVPPVHEGGEQGGGAGGSGNLGHAVGMLPCQQRGTTEGLADSQGIFVA